MNFCLCLLAVFLGVSTALLAAEVSGPTPDTSFKVLDTPTFEPTTQPTVEPTPQPTPKPDYTNNPDPDKALTLHKPRPSPAWGKVIQYHRERSEKDSETVHEFLFQDDNGTIRTAIYHENDSGDGYWEVWVWDQP